MFVITAYNWSGNIAYNEKYVTFEYALDDFNLCVECKDCAHVDILCMSTGEVVLSYDCEEKKLTWPPL